MSFGLEPIYGALDFRPIFAYDCQVPYSPLTRNPKMKISESLLPEFDHEMANTRKVLERVPSAKFSWKPHPKSFEFGALAAHIANMVAWAELTLQSDSFDYAPPGAEPYQTPKYASTEDLVAAFDKGVAKARTALAAADDAKMTAPWTLMAGGQTMMTMPRVAVIRSFVMNHTIHHRAQLTVYLRMNDVPVPALYGPSADEQ
jgi:uncharacterized damage-inducible protein DinB